jgi:hypothetical protein
VSGLSQALRDAGHDEIADKLEARELAGRLRDLGREDLADELDGHDAQPRSEEPQEPAAPATPQEQGQQLLDGLNRVRTPWFQLGGDDAA